MERFRQTVEGWLRRHLAIPIYARIRAWIRRRWLFLWLVASLLGVIVLIGLPMALLPPIYPVRYDGWIVVTAAAEHTVFVWQELFKQGLVLTAVIYAAAVAGGFPNNASIGVFSWRQIQLARLAAVLLSLVVPLTCVTIIRMVLLVVAVLNQGSDWRWFWPSVIYLSPSPSAWMRLADRLGIWLYYGRGRWLYVLNLLIRSRTGPLWATYYLMQPFFDALLFAAMTMTICDRSRAKSDALPTALAAAAGLWLAGYLGERLLAAGLRIGRTGWARVTWDIGLPALGAGSVSLSLLPTLLLVIIGIKLACLALFWRLALRRPA